MRTKIIAEMTSNHGGDVSRAKEMIKAARGAGADVAKFQSWRAEYLWKDAPQLRKGAKYDEDYAYYEKHQLSDADHETLKSFCEESGIDFLTTCFDVDRASFLASLGMERIKVASPDMTSWRLLDTLSENFREIIVSTGMHGNGEIVEMTEKLKKAVADPGLKLDRFVVLHCMSRYPTDPQYANLARMKWISSLGVEVGLSDHAMGCEISKAAIAMGAVYVEKHFTLDRTMDGRDQKMSTLPHEIRELAEYAKLVEIMQGKIEPEMNDYDAMLRENYIGKWGNNR